MNTTEDMPPTLESRDMTTVTGTTATTSTATESGPLAPTRTTATGWAQAGTSQTRNDTFLAEQMEDLNFYLRRMTVGGNGDISQIEQYSGGPDYEMFLDAVSSVGIHAGWTEGQLIRTIEMKLKDKAREYYGALLPEERPKTMIEMRSWFRRVFERKLTVSTGKRELERCIRHPGEPLGEYAQRLKVIANKMFPVNSLTSGEKLYHRNLLLVNQFIEGLEGRLANEVLRAGEFYHLNDCLPVAEQCEDIVSRMIPETRYDLQMSTISRIEAERANGSYARINPPSRDQPERHTIAYEPESRTSNSSRELVPYQREQSSQELVPYQGGQPSRETRTNRRYPGSNIRSGQAGRNRGEQYLVEQNQEPVRFGTNRNQGRNQYRRSRYPHRNSFAAKYPYMKNRCTRCGEMNHLAQECTAASRTFCYHCGKLGEICSLNSQRATVRRSR